MLRVDSYEGHPDASRHLTPAPLREKEASGTPREGLLPAETSLALCGLSTPPSASWRSQLEWGHVWTRTGGRRRPSVRQGARCSELGRAARLAAEAVFPAPARQLCPDSPQSPGPPVASTAPNRPTASVHSSRTSQHCPETTPRQREGQARVAWAGKGGFTSHDPQAPDLESRFCLHTAAQPRLSPCPSDTALCAWHVLSCSPRPPALFPLFSLEVAA